MAGQVPELGALRGKVHPSRHSISSAVVMSQLGILNWEVVDSLSHAVIKSRLWLSKVRLSSTNRALRTW